MSNIYIIRKVEIDEKVNFRCQVLYYDVKFVIMKYKCKKHVTFNDKRL